MQLVTPSEVQSAVSTVTMTCRIVFQVSFFIFFIPFFLVNNPVSVSGIPSMQFRGILPGSEPHQWVSLTMQRYNIFGRNAIVVPAFESACPGSCEKSGPGSWSFLRPDVGNITSRRRNCYVATQEKGRGGEREKVNGVWKKWTKWTRWTVNLVNLMENGYLKKDFLLRISYIIMYARKYYYLFSDEMYW